MSRKRNRLIPLRVAKPRLRAIDRSHSARIKMLIAPYEELVRAKLFPVLEFIVNDTQPRLDASTDMIERIFSGIRVTFLQMMTHASVDLSSQNTAQEIDRKNRDVHRQSFKTVLGVEPIAAEPWLIDEVHAFVSENASLIKTLPEESLSDIEQMIFRETRRGSSAATIKANIIEQFRLTEARAELIARDQVSKFNGRLTELRQKQSGIEDYIWRTAEDERTRPDHRRLNGETFSWDDPPITVTTGKRAGERNHPGSDISCRCYAEPILEALL